MARQRPQGARTNRWRPGKVKHPNTGQHKLKFVYGNQNTTAYVMREAKYTGGDAYWHDEFFALIRMARDGNGISDQTQGYVVSRGSFDELRHFPTKDEAMVYVQSLYALEVS